MGELLIGVSIVLWVGLASPVITAIIMHVFFFLPENPVLILAIMIAVTFFPFVWIGSAHNKSRSSGRSSSARPRRKSRLPA